MSNSFDYQKNWFSEDNAFYQHTYAERNSLNILTDQIRWSFCRPVLLEIYAASDKFITHFFYQAHVHGQSIRLQKGNINGTNEQARDKLCINPVPDTIHRFEQFDYWYANDTQLYITIKKQDCVKHIWTPMFLLFEKHA